MSKYNSVLLVDDDPIQVAILKAYFTSMQAENILTASNSSQALERLKEVKTGIDLIVTDLQMPEMDGIEFMRHLKSAEYAGKLAIVSGVKSDLLQHAGRLAKMHNLELIGHVEKPMTKDSLDAVFLKDSNSRRQNASDDGFDLSLDEFDEALKVGRILPHYQPKIDVRSGQIIGAEALARWFSLDGDQIPPNNFIPFAEHNGRMRELTFKMFDAVLKDMPHFLRIDPDLRIAVNLASNDINDVALPDQLNNRMKGAGVTSKNISFEVTEDSILDFNASTLEVLSRLRVLNFDVAIDDFGTGSSNIQTIRDFPYSELKIDRCFISNAVSNSFSRETVNAAVLLAHKQGMRVVAEGVEDMSTWQLLRELNIEHAQGYLLAKPMAAQDFITFVRENRNGITLVAA